MSLAGDYGERVTRSTDGKERQMVDGQQNKKSKLDQHSATTPDPESSGAKASTRYNHLTGPVIKQESHQ
jgi:hypothetical protein